VLRRRGQGGEGWGREEGAEEGHVGGSGWRHGRWGIDAHVTQYR